MTISRIFNILLFILCHGTARSDEPTNYLEGHLNFAPVARFNDLPTRHFMRPEFAPDVIETYMPEGYVRLFVRILEGDHDNEIQLQAARSLQRVAREKLAEPQIFVAALRARMGATNNQDVRRACAMALAAADLIEDAPLLAGVCRPDDETLSRHLESKLADWKSDVLLETWQNRLQAPGSVSRAQLVLACRGAAAVRAVPLVPDLLALANSDRISFAVRTAAAEAVAALSQEQASKTALRLSQAGLQDRIVSLALLTTASDNNSLEIVARLCDDAEDAVASRAWNLLVRLDPDRLLPHLKSGRRHRDPNIRLATVMIAELLPSLDRCDMLNALLGDPHIGVRNSARQALQQLAAGDESLYPRICVNAGDVTAATDAGWQQIEQALLLLGFLRHDVYQANCIALLQHTRPEVFVTAAWLLHIMPQKSLAEPAVSEAIRIWQMISSQSLPVSELNAFREQLLFLFHVAAYTGQSELTAVCAAQLDKASPQSVRGRAVGVWALGMLCAGTQDDARGAQFTERIFDDSALDPEAEEVKCAAAFALGLLGSPNSIPALRKAHQDYSTGGALGKSVSTALKMLGEQAPAPPEIAPKPIGNWPLRIVGPTTR